jgi:hypothetical protein
MTRLVTSGCSFTQYCWNTWADYLGEHFDEFQQVGLSGADNATIARNIITNAKEGDTVVIMWTGFDRWSMYTDGWQHHGCITGNKEFYVNNYHPIERFTTTMDYIKMVDLDSLNKGYNVYHFSGYSFFLSEFKTEHKDLRGIFSQYKINNMYVNDISLQTFQESINECFITSHRYNDSDTHPTPLTHWKYLNNIIAPVLNITINQSIKPDVVYEQDEVMAGRIPYDQST